MNVDKRIVDEGECVEIVRWIARRGRIRETFPLIVQIRVPAWHVEHLRGFLKDFATPGVTVFVTSLTFWEHLTVWSTTFVSRATRSSSFAPDLNTGYTLFVDQ